MYGISKADIKIKFKEEIEEKWNPYYKMEVLANEYEHSEYEAFKNMDAKQVRTELNSMRNVMADINTRMSAYFEDISKVPKSKEQER